MTILSVLNHWCQRVFGQFQWTKPQWIHALAARPWRTGGIILFIMACLGAFLWVQYQPKPLRIQARITAPRPTPLTETLTPEPLIITFGIQAKDQTFTPKPVAPLGSIGKTQHPEIHLNPDMPGQWVWETDDKLVFRPEKDWPAGVRYTISFDKKAFANPDLMHALHDDFSTAPFLAAIQDWRFYQDPLDANVRQAVAAIHFNFPVDADSLQSHINIHWQNTDSSTMPFDLTFDKHKRIAYVHSKTIDLPKEPRYLVLTLEKDIISASKTVKTSNNIEKSVLIPDRSAFFNITKTNTLIMHDEQSRPQQILTVETSIGIEETPLLKGIHVYRLPKHHTEAHNEANAPDVWQNPGEVSSDILKRATAIELNALPAASRYAGIHGFRFNIPQTGYLYLKIDKGTKGMGGFALKHDYQAILKIPEYPRQIRLIHDGSLLALTGEKKISLGVRGLKAVYFSIARVLPDNVTQLVTQTDGHFNDPYFLNESFDQNNISEIFSDYQYLANDNPAEEHYISLDLERYLNPNNTSNGPKGLFLLTANGYDQQYHVLTEPKTRRLILVTDLGMLVKDNADKTHDVFVQSITQGAPAVGVQVDVLGKNGLSILSRTTDTDGRVTFPDLSAYVDERMPAVYLAKQGTDISFIPYNKLANTLNYSRFDIGGVQTSQDDRQISAYAFSDRGMYRPGDTASFGIIVKKIYGQSLPEGLPIDITIIDPRGTRVLLEKRTLGKDGFLTLALPTKPTSPTGTYYLNVYLEEKGEMGTLLGDTSFKVQEFLPDRLRINARFSSPSAKGWLLQENMNVHVALNNLFGAPAANRRVTGKIILSPVKLAFEAFPDYLFTNPLQDPEKPLNTITENLPDATTDEQGQTTLPLQLDALPQGTLMLSVFIEGFEAEGGRSVTTQMKTLVSPLSYAIGYKSSADLQFIEQNAPRQVHLIAVSPTLQTIALPNLKIRLSEIRPITSLIKKTDGTFAYQSIPQTTALSTQPLSLAADGINYTLPTNQIGQFMLTILDAQDKPVGRIDYRVRGTGALNLSKNAELSLRLSRDVYKPGDPIILNLIAPYTGTGLITIEQDKVYAAKWFKTDQESTLEMMTLPSTLKGNAYINVAFTRDWHSPETFMSPLSYSVAPFDVDHQDAALPITLTLPQTVKPGDDLTITYRTEKPGKIILFGVDEGILQAARYQTPDPLSWFFQKRALMVTTQQTLDQILPKYINMNSSAVGGDDSETLIAAQLNPFKRQTQAPVTFWSDILDTDTAPQQFHYRIPDYFNGTLQIMAVAVGENTLGATNKALTIHHDFVINPNVPTFAAPDDEFTVSASIANQMKGVDADQPVSVRITASDQVTILGNTEQTLTIKPNAEQSVRFRLKANQKPGNATITLSVKTKDKENHITSTLSVRPASLYTTRITSGQTQEKILNLPIKAHLYPEQAHLRAMMSQNPLILVSGLSHYLDEYPYGCTEQLTSRAIPWLVMSQLPWFQANQEALDEKLHTILQTLTERQMSNGAFSYWPIPGYNENNRFISLYTLHFLTDAKAYGGSYVNTLLSNGLQYLQEIAQKTPTSLEEARFQAYAIYLLTRNEYVTTHYLTHLQTWLLEQKVTEHDLTTAYIAATYQLLQDEQEAMRLIALYDPKIPVQASDFFDLDVANTQYFYLLARHFPTLAQQKANTLMPALVARLNTSDLSTVLAGYTTMALQAYGDLLQHQSTSPLAIEQMIPNQPKQSISFNNTPFIARDIDLRATSINWLNPDKQTMFYQFMTSGFEQAAQDNTVQNGLEIAREYRDHDGNAVTAVQLGDELEVHISVRGLHDITVNNVAIVDLLPGGFEIVRESLNTQQADYIDIREDRLILFTPIDANTKEFVYRIKATNQGLYKIPPAYAHAMYLASVYAQTRSGEMTIL